MEISIDTLVANWYYFLIALLFLVIIAMSLRNRKLMKKNKEINKIIKEIREELRNEHKRVTVLFKDLDSFMSELPGVLAVGLEEKDRWERENYKSNGSNVNRVRKLSDYREEDEEFEN